MFPSAYWLSAMRSQMSDSVAQQDHAPWAVGWAGTKSSQCYVHLGCSSSSGSAAGGGTAAWLPKPCSQLGSYALTFQLHLCSSSSGAAPAADRSLAGLAEDLFEEAAFKAVCHKGVTLRLQRTKDGATQESRIHELASASNFTASLSITSTEACCCRVSVSRSLVATAAAMHSWWPGMRYQQSRCFILAIRICRPGAAAAEGVLPAVGQEPRICRPQPEVREERSPAGAPTANNAHSTSALKPI